MQPESKFVLFQSNTNTMQSTAKTVAEYLESLPTDRKQAISLIREAILTNLPKGYQETMSYGMIGYVVPHEIYPDGYHCTPKLPLPFMNVASQKNFIALYHMGIYADKSILDWFVTEYPKHAKTKLDMGKSCIRFNKVSDIPYGLIGELAVKMSVNEWIKIYETTINKIKN